MLKEALGIEPQLQDDGSYIPSPSALKIAIQDKSNYEEENFDNPYTGNQKVMMLCTEEQYMTMENGKKFSTGNQPVEMFVPLLHLNNAGFEIEIYTPTGKPVQIETWAIPEKDEKVTQILSKYKNQLQNPKDLSSFVANALENDHKYIALFIPGGHGALLGLPQNKNVGKVLKYFYQENLHILSICHGPAAFLAADSTHRKEDFIFNGYKIAAFPDSADATMPTIGYLPGDLTWKFNAELEKLGVEVVNLLPDKTCHQDRNLITAAGPLAADKFGKLMVKELLKVVQRQVD